MMQAIGAALLGALLLFDDLLGVSPIIGLPVASLFFLFVVVAVCQIQFARLITSSEGVMLSHFGLEIFTAWINIDRYTRVEGRWGILSYHAEGLVLRQPAILQKSQPWGLFVTRRIWLSELGKQGRFIPLGQLSRWQGSDGVVQDFRKYAPHIFVH
jgi:hypothetical protein